MADAKLLDIFLNAKRILCENDYYIHIQKKIIHLTNSENMIPHLMGMQYFGKSGMFTGDRGVYMIKKERLKYRSMERLIQKYYRGEQKQRSLLAMINGKINNLHKIEQMLATYSVLYLYDVTVNPESELKTDYLLVNDQEKMVLQLGMVKAGKGKTERYHCNSFIVDYKKNNNYDLHYRNLTRRYEINKIIRENKRTNEREVIYQSQEAKEREIAGIRKMLATMGKENQKLVEMIWQLNQKVGRYHTLDMLCDEERLKEACDSEEEMTVVLEIIRLLHE